MGLQVLIKMRMRIVLFFVILFDQPSSYALVCYHGISMIILYFEFYCTFVLLRTPH